MKRLFPDAHTLRPKINDRKPEHLNYGQWPFYFAVRAPQTKSMTHSFTITDRYIMVIIKLPSCFSYRQMTAK